MPKQFQPTTYQVCIYKIIYNYCIGIAVVSEQPPLFSIMSPRYQKGFPSIAKFSSELSSSTTQDMHAAKTNEVFIVTATLHGCLSSVYEPNVH